MKYATFDKNGFVKGFYAKDINGDNIPAEAIEITDDQWQEFLNNQGRRRWDFATNTIVGFDPNTEKIINDTIVKKTEVEILQELQQQALDINLQKYKEFCAENDNDYIKYLKRKELGIAKDKDKSDYDNALLQYKQKIEEYYATKEAIMNMTIEELVEWINENN